MVCYICHNIPDVEHKHHPELQAFGGRDKGTVVLCTNCHTSVHKEIDRLCSLYRRGKGGSLSVSWNTCRHSQEIQNATQIVIIGVKSILTFDGPKSVKTTLVLDPEVHQIVKTLKDKTGARNLPQVIIECIKYTASHSGLV